MKSLALVALFLAACGGSKPAGPASTGNPAPTPGSDLQMICDEATIAASRDSFASSVTAKLVTDEGRHTFAAAGMAADDEKNAVIKRAAAELGVANWDCGAPLERLYGPQAAGDAP